MIATHEMGHAIAWQRVGFQIVSITVRGRGAGTTGYVQLDGQSNRTPDEARDNLIGLLAGREADHRWCEIAGQPPDPYGSSADLAAYRKYRKNDGKHQRWLIHLSDNELRAAARKVVTTHWSRIVPLAKQLAERGRIRL
jgi:hypothetical protein